MSGFAIEGLDPELFAPLFGLSDDALAVRKVVRMRCDAAVGYPCRVTLADVEPGADVLLLNYEHQSEATPYRSAHAIFVREGAVEAARHENAVPAALTIRLLSVRAFDAAGMMTDADIVEGTALEPLIARMFVDDRVAYLHVHNARRGCFAARVDRL